MVMIRMVPFVLGLAFTAPYTWRALGLAKMSPLTAPVKRPRPVKPANPGSWPAPPPDISLLKCKIATLFMVKQDVRDFVGIMRCINDRPDRGYERQRRMRSYDTLQASHDKRGMVVEDVAVHVERA